MNIIEKRDFIHNHLYKADEKIVNEMFEKLSNVINEESVFKSKLTSRAKKAEDNILSGNVFTREEVEKRTNNITR